MKKVTSIIAVVLVLTLTACEQHSVNKSSEGFVSTQSWDTESSSDIQPESRSQSIFSSLENSDSISKTETKEDGMRTETYYIDNDDRIIAYIPNGITTSADGTVPMVLNLHWTGGTPEEQVSENGWIELAEKERFITIAPFYGSYDSVYNHTEHFANIVRDAYTRYPFIDKSRVYVTGFSNGGAAAVALTSQYPELFAAIAPQGWMVGMRDRSKAANFDMPFQIIQGNNEYTYTTDSGAPAIMTDEQAALRDLMLFNEMINESSSADYNKTAYWGYPSNDVFIMEFEEKKWEVSNYFKQGYTVPFGQLILVEDGIHWARKPHAQLAWEFMKHFRRNEKGIIVQIYDN